MSRKKKVFIFGGLLIAFFIFLAIIGSVVDTRDAVKNYESNQQEPHFNESTRKSMRTSYVNSCTQQGATEAYCACTWDYMMREFGMERVVEISIQAYQNSGSFNTIPSELSEAIKHCASEL